MRHLKWLGGLALMALLLSAPQAASRGAAEAMAHWYVSVAPSLFPFLALMPLLTCSEASQVYERWLGRAMETLFKLPRAAAPAMLVGMLAGTPAGVVAARRVAARSGMNRGQLHRMVVASSGFSPAFLVAGVGVGLLGSAAMGWKLLAAQLMAQLTLALLLRGAWRERNQPVSEAQGQSEEQPVRGAVLTLLTVCGYMALFGALTTALGAYIGSGPAKALLCLLEVPSGMREVAALPLTESCRAALLAAMCGFGGLCVAAQGLGVLKGCGMGALEYIGLRVLSGSINGGYMTLLTRIPAVDAGRLADMARGNPLALAGLFASLMAIPALLAMKKSIS